jgi:hypothetical protein
VMYHRWYATSIIMLDGDLGVPLYNDSACWAIVCEKLNFGLFAVVGVLKRT